MAAVLGSTPQIDAKDSYDFYVTYKPVTMVTNTIGCIVCIMFGFIVLFHRKSIQSEMTIIHWYSVVSIICFGISCAFLTAATSQNEYTVTFQVTQFMYGAIWVIAESVCYMIYILRLKNAFQATQYALSNKQLNIFYISVLIFFILNLIIWGIVGLDYNTPRIQTKRAFIIDAALCFCLQIIDLMVSGILIYLFINKLMLFMKQFNDETKFAMNELNDSSYKLSMTQKSIVQVITKSFILSLFIIISTQINLISNAILYLMVQYRDDKIFLLFYIVQTTISAINCVMSSICIYLNFDFGQKCYDRLCGKIHIYFTLIFKKYSENKMSKVLESNHYTILAQENEIHEKPNSDL